MKGELTSSGDPVVTVKIKQFSATANERAFKEFIKNSFYLVKYGKPEVDLW